MRVMMRQMLVFVCYFWKYQLCWSGHQQARGKLRSVLQWQGPHCTANTCFTTKVLEDRTLDDTNGAHKHAICRIDYIYLAEDATLHTASILTLSLTGKIVASDPCFTQASLPLQQQQQGA